VKITAAAAAATAMAANALAVAGAAVAIPFAVQHDAERSPATVAVPTYQIGDSAVRR
jgi:hypothetical protein